MPEVGLGVEQEIRGHVFPRSISDLLALSGCFLLIALVAVVVAVAAAVVVLLVVVALLLLLLVAQLPVVAVVRLLF